MEMQSNTENSRRQNGRGRNDHSPQRKIVRKNGRMGGPMRKQPSPWRYRGEKDKDPLHYVECGLDDIYLVSGYEIVDTPDGPGLSVKNLDELHKAIGYDLVNKKKLLSGKELRFLR